MALNMRRMVLSDTVCRSTNIARDQYGIDLASGRNGCQPLDHLERASNSAAASSGFELREHAAYLPVRGVEQRNCVHSLCLSRLHVIQKERAS